MIGRVALAVLAVAAGMAARGNTPPRIAIIIDDVGYRAALDARALELPVAVGIAVLPDAPHARRVAEAAAMQSRDVLVHLPMQSLGGASEMPDYGSVKLSIDTTRADVERVVAEALAAVPQAIGINNHMGSRVTREPGHMRWLMQTIACYRDLFFIDSFTTHESVAFETARRQLVPAARRDVFLDDARDAESVRAQFRRLVRLAHERGQALAIGHPQPDTLAVLEQELADLEQYGVTLVPATALLERAPRDLDNTMTTAGTAAAP